MKIYIFTPNAFARCAFKPMYFTSLDIAKKHLERRNVLWGADQAIVETDETLRFDMNTCMYDIKRGLLWDSLDVSGKCIKVRELEFESCNGYEREDQVRSYYTSLPEIDDTYHTKCAWIDNKPVITGIETKQEYLDRSASMRETIRNTEYFKGLCDRIGLYLDWNYGLTDVQASEYRAKIEARNKVAGEIKAKWATFCKAEIIVRMPEYKPKAPRVSIKDYSRGSSRKGYTFVKAAKAHPDKVSCRYRCAYGRV